MRYHHHSVRLSPALNHTLMTLAAQRGVSSYSLLCRAAVQGLGAMSHPQEQAELALALGELTALSARLDWLEALLDRSLFVASASYAYARHAALHSDRDPKATDTNISAQAEAAFARQKNHAKGSHK